MELPANQSSVSKRTKKENILSVSTPKVSKAEKLREQKEREFDMLGMSERF